MAGWTPLKVAVPGDASIPSTDVTADIPLHAWSIAAEEERPGTDNVVSAQGSPPGKRRMSGYTATKDPTQTPTSNPPALHTAPQQTPKRAEESRHDVKASIHLQGEAATKPSGKQRMAGYTPMNSRDQPSPETRRLETGDVPKPAVSPAPATAADPPARKQRMGLPTANGEKPSGSAEAPVGQRLGQPASDSPTPAPPSAAPKSTQADASLDRSPSAPSPGLPREAPATGSQKGSKTKSERRAWIRPVGMTAGLLAVALVAVLAARWLFTLSGVQDFVASYPGRSTMPDTTPEGLPVWMGWQHYLNMFFIVLIARTGLQIRLERRPPGYWTPKKDSFFSPKGNSPKKVSISQWLHQTLDVLWVLNGALFIILLFITGHWMRIVPTNWDIFPNMLSAALQYASLNWPTENGWIYYNALQMLAYFLTVFLAAPLAVISGVRMSTWWPEKAVKLSKAYPVEWARAVHLPVMVYFCAFTLVHVLLVFLTGAMQNLNHMYGSRDTVDAWGLVIFLASLLVIAAGWLLTKPLFITPLAGRTGTVSK
ncbi:cytochrome b/b6 domain-containing protein [Arthrobacter sp. NPDC080031]|uniref:cytochrome b/b6 domain-containing protein n=1 Tax=Arthrobacter sp. NPDC080031 TaxID=3155918 RepID=UPI0034505CA1